MRNWLRKILPKSFILWTHKVRGILAAALYGFPGKKLKIIAVTGTNGKTTTSHFIASILEEKGFKVGMATTIDFKIGDKVWGNETKMTTLSPFVLQRLLRQMLKEKCDYVVLETTSHAITQHRLWGIKFQAAVLTNVTHDHLDYHQTFAAYKETKLELFRRVSQTTVVNRQDPSADEFLAIPAKQKFSYGISLRADVMAKKLWLTPEDSHFTIVYRAFQIPVDLKLPGRFNILNALAAASLGIALGIGLEKIKRGLEKVEAVSGRMEKVDKGQDFTVIVDFAHTPDALKNIFQTIDEGKKGKIIWVGGATGRRDTTKRPILGGLASRFADIVIVTNEDPYDEDPMAIIEAVAKGVKTKVLGKNFFKILDRKEAIEKTLSLAQRNDIILITGKGGESKMAVGHGFIPWSDREIVEEFLERNNS